VVQLLGASFYDGVLRELVAALGAALFFANLWALYRRKADAQVASHRTIARNRAGSPVRGYRRTDASADLPQAPVLRTTLYMLIRFVVMVAGIGAVINK